MDVGKVLIFLWALGAAYTWGRVMIYMKRNEHNPLSVEGGMSAAGCIFVWPVILGWIDGDRGE